MNDLALLSITERVGNRIATITGEIDLSNAAQIGAALEADADGKLIIDLTDLDSIDSSGLAVVARLAGVSRSEERRVGKECNRSCRSRWSPYH